MIEGLRKTYYRLLDELEIDTFRYLYHSFSIDGRLTGLVGPRGVGKTTLLLQFIKNQIHNQQDAFYFSADHIYFNKNSLWEFVQQLYEEEDVKLFFIDEIHKYDGLVKT
ncbi:MAG: AAA family ATPase [Thermodesulfobacteriota bacterium]|nr:AAA family ATPase [Thermodesulfobacteriota bacterium]